VPPLPLLPRTLVLRVGAALLLLLGALGLPLLLTGCRDTPIAAAQLLLSCVARLSGEWLASCCRRSGDNSLAASAAAAALAVLARRPHGLAITAAPLLHAAQ
jgi:hypothetical protein